MLSGSSQHTTPGSETRAEPPRSLELAKETQETLEAIAHSSDQCVTLQRLLEAQRWEEALAQVDQLLEANPCAAQLHLLRGQPIQWQDENTPYALEDAEKAFHRAVELDATYFDALVELMHFYDAVCPDTPKAVAYAKQVKALAQKALAEARTILDEAVDTPA